jgi:hypothetical protein
MEDLGPPISPLALPEGVPVFDPEGERVGVVERVVFEIDIFDGLVIHTHPLPGRHVFAGHEQIAQLGELGVRLAVGVSELHSVERPSRRRHDSSPEHPFERRLRRAWDALMRALD